MPNSRISSVGYYWLYTGDFVDKSYSLERIYQRFEHDGEGIEKLRLSKPELVDYILKVIAKTLGPVKSANLTPTVDLFAFGVDSLQGTRIRNQLQKELELGGQVLGQNGKTCLVGWQLSFWPLLVSCLWASLSRKVSPIRLQWLIKRTLTIIRLGYRSTFSPWNPVILKPARANMKQRCWHCWRNGPPNWLLKNLLLMLPRKLQRAALL